MPNEQKRPKTEHNGCWYNPSVKTIYCCSCGNPVVIPLVFTAKSKRIGNEVTSENISSPCMQCGKNLRKVFKALGCIGCAKLCCDRCVREVCDRALEKIGILPQTKVIGFT